MNADDMTPDVPDDGPPGRDVKKFLRTLFTTDVGLWWRLSLPLGFLLVAMQTSLWWSLGLVVAWSLNAQMALVSAHMKGWIEGVNWLEALNSAGSINVDMMDLIDLCDRYSVPPQEVEKMIWKEDR